MAGEENNKQQKPDAVALLAQLLSGGTTGVATSGVYLGNTSQQVMPPAGIAKPGAKPKTVKMPKVVSTQEANKLYLTDPKLQSAWRAAMKKNGLETGNPVVERQAWQVAVTGAADWYSTSGGTAKVTPEQYLTWWAGGQKKTSTKAPALPTRQIYDVPKAQVEADVDTAAQSILGRTIQAEDKTQDWYKSLVKSVNDMYQKGIVTTVKEVVNPATGKKEKQVIQKPGYSKEKIAATIETGLKGASPVDVERKERVDFTKWLYSQMGGQG
jgi:hypothetical protein